MLKQIIKSEITNSEYLNGETRKNKEDCQKCFQQNKNIDNEYGPKQKRFPIAKKKNSKISVDQSSSFCLNFN